MGDVDGHEAVIGLDDFVDELFSEHTYIEVDQVIVDKTDWGLLKSGDLAARKRVRDALSGIELYAHIIPIKTTECVVGLRELEDTFGIRAVTVSG